jgi:hypothetical protein
VRPPPWPSPPLPTHPPTSPANDMYVS